MDEKDLIETKVIFDGKISSEKNINKTKNTTHDMYIDARNKDMVHYTKTEKKGEAPLITKFVTKNSSLPIGIDFDQRSQKWPHMWKYDEKASMDNLLVFRDQLKDKEIDDYYSTEGFVFTDSKGVIEMVFTYDA